jgi:hypothetical protein
MLCTPDFSEVQDEIAPGTYKCLVKKAELKEWGPDKGSYVNWQLETYGEAEPKNNGRVVFHKTSVSGRGAFMLQKFYRAAMGKVLGGSFDTTELLGKQVEVTVVEGMKKDNVTGEMVLTGYNEVKNVKPVSN